MDIKQISKTILRNIKTRVIGKSTYGHQDWANADPYTYYMFHDTIASHDDFMEYFNNKQDVKSVLEVGCGAGVYPIRIAELFKDIDYTGNDFSQQCIDHCKKNSKFNFICGDFIKMNPEKKYDMVFSHSVVDHVYDPVTFITNIVKSTKKYAYISNYLGYFPDLKKHKMNWRDDQGCSYNNLSLSQLKEDLLKIGLTDDEIIIRSFKGGNWELHDGMITIIEITKKNS